MSSIAGAASLVPASHHLHVGVATAGEEFPDKLLVGVKVEVE
jgi:hypothetical protein